MYMFKFRFLLPRCDHLPLERLRVVDGASAVLLHKDRRVSIALSAIMSSINHKRS